MPNRTRTALYLRVSTADQKPDLQYDGLRSYAARAGLDIVGDYLDVAVSVRKQGRLRLNALMTAVRNREYDCVLGWKFDRFARSTRHLLIALEEFTHLGCVLSVFRIRLIQIALWGVLCLRLLVLWLNWNPRSLVSGSQQG